MYYGHETPGAGDPIPAITDTDRDLLAPILGGEVMCGLAARDQQTSIEVSILIIRAYNAGKHGHIAPVQEASDA